ncbi:MAG: hypothetical protein ACI3ZQ_05770 [Candidatus Cryptobacteroides sp.]
MLNIFNEVYNEIRNLLKEKYPTLTTARKIPKKAPDFPAWILFPLDNYTDTDTLTSSGVENHAIVTLQMETYSNLTSGGEEQCERIADIADSRLMLIGFVRTYASFMDASSPELTRFVCRYRSKVGRDNLLYRK